MSESILDTTKKALGLGEDYDVFDEDVLMHINSVFLTLNQLGVGPLLGFQISDSSDTWEDFYGNDPRFNAVRSYMYKKLRLVFDPPTTSFTIAAFEKMIEEDEFRLKVMAETVPFVPVIIVVPVDPED